MGLSVKLLSIQMTTTTTTTTTTSPWCLSLLWNPLSCLNLRETTTTTEPPEEEAAAEAGMLIKSDGAIDIYREPINASDLMLEFPEHLICHSDSFYIGKKIPALSHNDKLQLGHKYFLLPKHFFQSVLSFVTIASFSAATSNNSKNNHLLKTAATCQAFDIHKSPTGSLQIRVSDEFISKLMEKAAGKTSSTTTKIKGEDESSWCCSSGSRICTTPELEKDYSQLIMARPQWRPKLETITESERRRMRKMKRFASFGIYTTTPTTTTTKIKQIRAIRQSPGIN